MKIFYTKIHLKLPVILGFDPKWNILKWYFVGLNIYFKQIFCILKKIISNQIFNIKTKNVINF